MVSSKDVYALKRRCLPGTRLLLIHMEDKYPVPDNTRCTVEFVDDIGDIHCTYDGYSSTLAIVPDVDDFRLLTEEELKEEGKE